MAPLRSGPPQRSALNQNPSEIITVSVRTKSRYVFILLVVYSKRWLLLSCTKSVDLLDEIHGYVNPDVSARLIGVKDDTAAEAFGPPFYEPQSDSATVF